MKLIEDEDIIEKIMNIENEITKVFAVLEILEAACENNCYKNEQILAGLLVKRLYLIQDNLDSLY